MKRITGILAVIMLLLIPTTVSAQVGNKYSSGAVIPKYEETVTIQVDGAKFDRTLNQALIEAGQKASKRVQYKIIIPPGSYQAGRRYIIPSNTYIYAKGATIHATGTRVSMFSTDSQKKSQNIIVESGTWTTLEQPSSVNGTVIRLMGVKNMVLKDMTIKTKRSMHIIEVADMYGFTVTGCRISGNNLDTKEPYHHVQPKEALQLDVATPEAMPGYDYDPRMYNGKGCHKVLIKNNTFVNCARGIGAYSGTGNGAEKNPYTYITVSGNKIKNLIGEAVFGQDWKYSTITGNQITTCKQAGIFLLDAYSVRVNKNVVRNVGRYTGARKKTYDPRGVYGTGILAKHSNTVYMDNNTLSKVYNPGILLEENCRNITNKNNKTYSVIKK